MEIDASCGLYDWIRQSVRVGSSAGRLIYKDVKIGTGGEQIVCPPGFDPKNPHRLSNNEINLNIIDIGGLDIPSNIPGLDEFINDDDLKVVRPDLPIENLRSP